MRTIETVAVIGLGYIGLPTAAVLASNGINVIGVDVKASSVEAINRGEVPFVEPDLATQPGRSAKANSRQRWIPLRRTPISWQYQRPSNQTEAQTSPTSRRPPGISPRS